MEATQKSIFKKKKKAPGFLNSLADKLRQMQLENAKLKQRLAALKGK